MTRRTTNLGTLVLLLAAMFFPPAISARACVSSQPTTTPSSAVVIPLRGQIDDFNRDALFKRFDEARRLGAKTIIVEINTYGGLVTAGLDISQFLKRQNDLHTIAFVHEKAISAGAMIAMACDEIVMEPGSKIGDCAPIAMGADGTLQSLGAAERAKLESPILADFHESAVRNGHDPQVAAAMVEVGRAVHWIEDQNGSRRFVDTDEFVKLTKDGQWKAVPDLPDPIDSANTLLTVHADAAAKLGLAKEIATSPAALAIDRGYNIVATLEPSAGEIFVGWLGSSLVRGILMIVFLQSLYLAFHIPGHGAPEAVAVTSLALLLGIPLLTGYAQWWEIVVILGGIALLAFEIFVFPGHFVSGVIGAVMVIGGLVMTFVPKEPGGMPGILPHFGATWAALQQGLLVVTGGLACSLFLWFWLNRYLPKLPYFNRLILTTPTGDTASAKSLIAPVEWPAVGVVGRAVTDLRPGGSAEFYDAVIADRRITDVISDSGYVRSGTEIVVREVEGSRVVVRAMG